MKKELIDERVGRKVIAFGAKTDDGGGEGVGGGRGKGEKEEGGMEN